MYFLKMYWENNHKGVPDYYPPDFMQLVVPSYIFTWLLSVYYSGGYDKPIKPARIIQGLVIGTFIIAGITNFLDDFRFSKALILLGSVWATAIMLFWRIGWHFIKFGNLNLGAKPSYRYAIAGNPAEAQRIYKLIAGFESNAKYIGFISESKEAVNFPDFLGSIALLPNFLKYYQLSELVVCGNGYTNKQAIDLIRLSKRYQLRIRTVVPESNYVIGSQSKNTNGDIYSAISVLKLFEPDKLRSKRLFDVLAGLLLLPISPLLIPFTKAGFRLPLLLVQILVGTKCWVASNPAFGITGKGLRKGLLYPEDAFSTTDKATAKRINELYASDYTVYADIEVLFKAFKQLGSR